MSNIRSVRWGVPVREDTCPGPLALWGRVASSFPRRLYLPSVSTGPPSLLGGQWVSIQPLALGGFRTVVFGTVGKRSNRYAIVSSLLSRASKWNHNHDHNHHKSSSIIIINHHQSSSIIIINHHHYHQSLPSS